MVLDVDGNKLTLNTRVAVADNVNGITMKIGKVIGYTETRVKIDFGDGKRISTRDPDRIVKVFVQGK